jgi:ATP-binding protein involved in chromosome partitioning
MAWFTPAELPDNKYYIFGKEGGKRLADELNIPLLGQIPLVQSIRECGDSGRPIAFDENSILSQTFKDFAQQVVKRVEIRNSTMAATKKVEMMK